MKISYLAISICVGGSLAASARAQTTAPADITWNQYGTRGATADHAQGQAACNLDDVRQDDLNTTREIPPSQDANWPRLAADATGFCGTADETLSWRLVNCERVTLKLAPLDCDLRMVWLGRLHSQDMVARDFFAHSNPDGQSPFDRMQSRGVKFRTAGENIALNSSVLGAHQAWMNSDGHRANILNPAYRQTGIGIATGQRSWGPVLLLSQELIASP